MLRGKSFRCRVQYKPLTMYPQTQPCSIYLENEELEYPLKTTYLVPIYSIISGLHHFIAAISLGRNDGFYKNQIFGGINVVRWLDYALSSSLMLVVRLPLSRLSVSSANSLLWLSVFYACDTPTLF